METGSATVVVAVSLTTSGTGTRLSASGGSRRGTSNSNSRGNSKARRSRRKWLVETYRADRDVLPHPGMEDNPIDVALGEGVPACRCYRCGTLLTEETVTADRIIPGIEGGSYRRENIRPCCGYCNSSTGAMLAHQRREARAA